MEEWEVDGKFDYSPIRLKAPRFRLAKIEPISGLTPASAWMGDPVLGTS